MEYLLAVERKESLESNKFSLEKQINEQLYSVEQLKHEHKNQLSQLDRLSYDNEQQSVEVKQVKVQSFELHSLVLSVAYMFKLDNI